LDQNIKYNIYTYNRVKWAGQKLTLGNFVVSTLHYKAQRWAGYVARFGKTIKAHNLVGWKAKFTSQLEDVRVRGK
jgi:hypothetical protein